MTYAAPIKVTTQLMIYDTREGGERIVRDIKEQEVYFGEIPLMTDTGTFIINGTERVVVSQLHRSPGVFFDHDKGKTHSSGKLLYSARVIPYRGSWLDFEFDPKDIIYVRIDRRRKMHATVLLRALGYSTQDLLNYFYNTETVFLEKGGKYARSVEYDLLAGQRATRDVKIGAEVIVKKNTKFTKAAIKKLKEAKIDRMPIDPEELVGKVAAHDVVDKETGEVVLEVNEEVTDDKLEKLREASIESFKILFIDGLNVGSYLRDTLLAEKVKTTEDAIMEIYRRLRPGDPPTLETAKTLFNNLFFNPERYDLSKVGRLKLNYKFYRDLPEDQRPALDTQVLTPQDILETVRHLIELKNGRGSVDDIDHLGNRRVRAVGELMENQYRIGLVRMERAIKERMSMSQEIDTLMPHDLINAKPVSAVVKEYFGSSQLSQFMDQTNPLSEVTHKRRLSALGPGGLTRERAGFEVRDVHPTHYGRICPIETPEGPNIGLIASLSTFARVNEYGFVETPYRKVVGRPRDRRRLVVLGARGGGQVHRPGLREHGREGEVPREPRQRPLERRLPHGHAGHDPAHGRRAEPDGVGRRGARAVPRARRREPRAHGREHAASGRAAHPIARAVRRHRHGGEARARLRRVHPRPPRRHRGERRREPHRRPRGRRQGRDPRHLLDDQVPAVEPVDLLQPEADRPRGREGEGRATSSPTARHCDMGELALGQNVLVAFMPWQGYNFEDSILVSERIAKDDVFTSIHIEEFECVARDTKLGKEEVTRDIPNVGEEALKDLDESGIVRIGAEVKSGDILVGKITPKGETQLSPEEKLLRAIFGEKAGDVRDSSLRVPPGVGGIVINARVFTRKGTEKDERAKDIEDHERVRLEKMRDEEIKILRDSFFRQIKRTARRHARRRASWSTTRARSSSPKGQELDEASLDVIPRKYWGELPVEGAEELATKLKELEEIVTLREEHFRDKIDRLSKGDELPPGVIKMVKVYIAIKRKLQVGDKMAGRHGNKGVISRIMAEEDMPYLQDGRPVDIVLNPLGVPSRMNVGQILETHLGWGARVLGWQFQYMLDVQVQRRRRFASTSSASSRGTRSSRSGSAS